MDECHFQQHGRDEQQVSRTKSMDERSGDCGTEQPTQSASDPNESEQTLTLSRAKHVRHEGPEYGDHKQIEHTRPDEQDPPNPDIAGIRQHLECDKEEDQVCHEEPVRHGDKPPPREPHHESREDGVQYQHRDQRTGEEPGEVTHAASHTHLVADRAYYVVGRQDAEEVCGRKN